MSAAIFALISFCGRGSVRLFDQEHEGKESLALSNALGCGSQCTRNHRLIVLGDVIA